MRKPYLKGLMITVNSTGGVAYIVALGRHRYLSSSDEDVTSVEKFVIEYELETIFTAIGEVSGYGVGQTGCHLDLAVAECLLFRRLNGYEMSSDRAVSLPQFAADSSLLPKAFDHGE